MGLNMRKSLVAALVLLAMTSVVIVRTLRLSPKEQLLENPAGESSRCLNYLELCVPWRDQCCNGMACTNFGRGFCMHGLEPCICQLLYDVDVS